MQKHREAVGRWDTAITEFYSRCSVFGRLVQRAGNEVAWWEVHEYAEHGALGLHQLRADRANDKGTPFGQFVGNDEPPF